MQRSSSHRRLTRTISTASPFSVKRFAAELEGHVDAAVTEYLRDQQRLIKDFSLAKQTETTRVFSSAVKLSSASQTDRWSTWRALIKSVTYTESILCIQLHKYELCKTFALPIVVGSVIDLDHPISLHRIGNDIRLVIPASSGQPEAAKVDSSLIRFVARGRKWFKQLTSGERSLTAIARSEQVTVTYVARVIRGSLLAPDIVQRIIEGRQPIGLTVQALSIPIPVDWAAQREHFVRLSLPTQLSNMRSRDVSWGTTDFAQNASGDNSLG